MSKSFKRKNYNEIMVERTPEHRLSPASTRQIRRAKLRAEEYEKARSLNVPRRNQRAIARTIANRRSRRAA